jgi:hypothetical protein
VPAEEQKEEVIAYAESIAKARAEAQRAAREAVGLKPYGLAQRTTIAEQTLVDQEADKIGCTFLFRLAAVGRVTCGSFVRFARDIEKLAEKLRRRK